MRIKVTTDNYPEIIEVYNTEGKTAAYDLIRSKFGIKNPTCVVKRLKQSSELSYNPEADRFEMYSSKEEEGIFLNLEELCNNKPATAGTVEDEAAMNARVLAMENMMHSLISDRLLELSKYVLLDPIGRRIMIDKTMMQADGYHVNIC